MIVTIEGKRYEFDHTKLRLSELKVLKQKTGLTLGTFTPALAAYDPDALGFMVWLLRRRSGDEVEFEDVDFDLSDITVEDPPDPTSGATSGPAAASTSDSSGSSSASPPETTPAASIT